MFRVKKVFNKRENLEIVQQKTSKYFYTIEGVKENADSAHEEIKNYIKANLIQGEM